MSRDQLTFSWYDNDIDFIVKLSVYMQTIHVYTYLQTVSKLIFQHTVHVKREVDVERTANKVRATTIVNKSGRYLYRMREHVRQ